MRELTLQKRLVTPLQSPRRIYTAVSDPQMVEDIGQGAGEENNDEKHRPKHAFRIFPFIISSDEDMQSLSKNMQTVLSTEPLFFATQRLFQRYPDLCEWFTASLAERVGRLARRK